MWRATWFLCLGVAVFAGVPGRAADNGLDGKYELSFFAGARQVHALLVQFETKDGKLTGTVVSFNPNFGGDGKIGSVTLADKILRFNVKGAAEQNFEGKLGQGDILGSMVFQDHLYPAKLAKTDLTEVNRQITPVNVEPFTKAQDLTTKARRVMFEAGRTQDKDKKAELSKQAAELALAADKEVPALYREVIEKHADSTLVFDAGYNLLGDPKTKVPAEEARKYSEALEKAAQAYGPKLEAETRTRLAELFVKKDNLKDLGLEYARKAEKSLPADVSTEERVRTLKVLATALRNSKQTDELKDVEARVAKLDEVLDREYLAKMPPFKPAGFPGRKGNSQRVLVMELFTGAQCPPCVAADAAFDGLETTYKPADVILLQYHMHIPGPDPLTNPDSEARMKYYSKKFPRDVGGTPSTIFNGKANSFGGGGPLAQSERKYNQYREHIDKLLEETTPVHVGLTADRKGNHIDLKAEVSDVPEPGETKRLRFVLIEEQIRYVGSNKMRFHHHVVRALPGGVDGIVLKEPKSQQSISIDLDELRQRLVEYLEDSDKKRPFPYPERPLDFKNLKAVAFVQDDATGEILQAAQVDLGGE